METTLRQARIAYLGGTLEEETTQLPEALLNRIEGQFPNLHIGLVEREIKPGGVLYEVIASTGREWLEIMADPSGEIWVVDRKPLSELFAMIEAAVHSDETSGMALFVFSPDGQLLAGTVSPQTSPDDLDSLQLVMSRLDEPWIARGGADLFGGIILYDGNVLYVVNRLQEMKRITQWSLEYFVMLMAIFIPLSAWIGFHISQKAMAGVQRVADAANRVRVGNFAERVAGASEGTEIEELAAAFNAMVSHIDLLMGELRNVTANIAHDLKTPIMRIRGLLESMTWEEVSASEREQIMASALEECDRIMPLIDSILELSRAEAGMLVLQKEDFDLATEVCSAHDIFSTLAEDRSIAFNCTVPDDPVPMVGDRGRMQRVIANLIDNALKFTPAGGKVCVKLEASAHQAVLIIRDNGPGIPGSELENVFKRFYRLDPSRSMSGHGMGLSMVQAFVNAFGGAVSIESDTGKGCTVKVVVPTYVDKADPSI
jgi:signal transduction histidine kinase